MRLFTGIKAEHSILPIVDKIRQRNDSIVDIKWVPASNLHITTCFIGETPEKDIDSIIRTVKHIVAGSTTFELQFDRFTTWPKSKPYMIWALYRENEAFSNLYNRLNKILTGNINTGPVLPHITLARFKNYQTARFVSLGDFFYDSSLMPEEMVLYESTLLKSGAEYRIISQYPFSKISPAL